MSIVQLKLLLHRKGRSRRIAAGSRVALTSAHAHLAIAALGKCCWQVWKQQLSTMGSAGLGGAGQPAQLEEQALVVSELAE